MADKPRRGRGRLIVLLLVVLGLGGVAAWFGPDWIGGEARRGRLAYEAGRWTESEATARKLLRQTPKDLEARRLLARSLARLKRDGEAIPIYKTLSMEQMASEDLFLLGSALLRKGNRTLAQDAIESSRKLDPLNVESLRALIDYYEEDDDLAHALEVAEKLTEVRSERAFAFARAALLAEGLDNPGQAVEAWENAFKADPKLKGAPVAVDVARRHWASMLLRQGKAQEAIDVLKQDASSEGLWLLSRAQIQRGDWRKAQTALNHAGGPEAHPPITAEPSPYVGSARCAECHDAIFTAQSTSRHAKTFHLGSNLDGLKIPSDPIRDPKSPSVVHRFARQENGVWRLESKVDKDTTYQAFIDFAFGSGDRGLTFVGHDQDGWGRELRLSHYGEGQLWDMTIGQLPNPSDPTDIVGRPLSPDDVRRCVGCHVTHVGLGIDRKGPEAKDGAIGCERCHGPGAHHIAAVEAEFSDLAIARPKAVVGEPMVNLCGGCHKPKSDVTRATPGVVRFQAATLTWSKCYQQSFGKLDCLNCHNPHRNAETSPAYYEKQCLNCHVAREAVPTNLGPRQPDERMKRVVCPVNPKNGCIGCHMPSDTTSLAHSPFTDHEIRVHAKPKATTSNEGASTRTRSE